jgi:hypothetical protein
MSFEIIKSPSMGNTILRSDQNTEIMLNWSTVRGSVGETQSGRCSLIVAGLSVEFHAVKLNARSHLDIFGSVRGRQCCQEWRRHCREFFSFHCFCAETGKSKELLPAGWWDER